MFAERLICKSWLSSVLHHFRVRFSLLCTISGGGITRGQQSRRANVHPSLFGLGGWPSCALVKVYRLLGLRAAPQNQNLAHKQNVKRQKPVANVEDPFRIKADLFWMIAATDQCALLAASLILVLQESQIPGLGATSSRHSSLVAAVRLKALRIIETKHSLTTRRRRFHLSQTQKHFKRLRCREDLRRLLHGPGKLPCSCSVQGP